MADDAPATQAADTPAPAPVAEAPAAPAFDTLSVDEQIANLQARLVVVEAAHAEPDGDIKTALTGVKRLLRHIFGPDA